MDRAPGVERAARAGDRRDRGLEPVAARVHVRLDTGRLEVFVRDVELVLRVPRPRLELSETVLDRLPALLDHLLVHAVRRAAPRCSGEEVVVRLLALRQELQADVDRERERGRRWNALRVDGGGRRGRRVPRRRGRRRGLRARRRGGSPGAAKAARRCGEGRDQGDDDRDGTARAGKHPCCSRHLRTASSADSAPSPRSARDNRTFAAEMSNFSGAGRSGAAPAPGAVDPTSCGELRSRGGPCRPGCRPGGRGSAPRGCSS